MITSIEPLGKHGRAHFACGVAALDEWFHLRAGQDEKRNAARVFVSIDDRLGVVGFYSLSTFTLTIPDMPAEYAKRIPRYGLVPAALIGRLARDLRVRGMGVGELLLADAVRRILSAAHTLAVFAIVVEAKDDLAARFYRDFGFEPFPNRPLRLFMPVSQALSALQKAGGL
jgi:GNAT superfamily N-acetyltransferase